MSTVSVFPNVIRGTSRDFTATYTDIPAPYGTGGLTDVDSHSISVYDANGNIQTTATTPTHVTTGTYLWNYQIPATGVIGKWRIVWEMTKGGIVSGSDTWFNVTT